MSRLSNVIRSKQDADPISDTQFIGIYYSERRGYIACTAGGSKSYKTEKGARKYLRTIGYDC